MGLICNGSIFIVFGSLRALDLIFRIWDLDFRNSRLKLHLWTKFYADWTILIFSMTSWPHPNFMTTPQLPCPNTTPPLNHFVYLIYTIGHCFQTDFRVQRSKVATSVLTHLINSPITTTDVAVGYKVNKININSFFIFYFLFLHNSIFKKRQFKATYCQTT